MISLFVIATLFPFYLFRCKKAKQVRLECVRKWESERRRESVVTAFLFVWKGVNFHFGRQFDFIFIRVVFLTFTLCLPPARSLSLCAVFYSCCQLRLLCHATFSRLFVTSFIFILLFVILSSCLSHLIPSILKANLHLIKPILFSQNWTKCEFI